MHWYLEVLRRTGDFEGRSRPKEFWMSLLVHLGICLLMITFDVAVGLLDKPDGIPIFYYGYNLLMFIPNLAVTVRRFHDIGYSGFYFLLCCIPCIGPLLYLIWMARPGDPGRNQYGPDPLDRPRKKKKKKKPRPVEEDDEDEDDEPPPPKRKRAAEPQWEVVEDEEERPPPKRKPRAAEPQWEVVEDEEERPRPRNPKRPRPRDED